MFYMEQSISRQVLMYIQRKPYIQEAIENDIVNYSALARKISKEIKANFEAVKASLIRHAKKLRMEKKYRGKKIIKLLRKSNFSIRNKIVAVHSSHAIQAKCIAFSKTPSGYMYFLDENEAEKIDRDEVTHVKHGLAMINIKSSIQIEETPGVAAFLLTALASENINVFHLMDCREDTFLVIKEEDAPIAFKALSEKLRLY